ncbi:hypothetical protein [Zongyangia hominis]|uniref:Uncharacterized protein n=1 Tax=Zongyangia hominis TaxID=2763677 RepID=A0A926EEB6_9FIRM|nr:hypothetical protein [Zongyangia hominis]MBC8570531.1 hypothetical protein [Zongyangia hominis]
MELMQFKSYVWPYNPQRVEITLGRDLRTRQARGFGTLVSDWGQTPARVEGEGEFFGSDCKEQFERLRRIFDEEGSGKLLLPSFRPVYAYFESLKLLGEGPLHTLRYGFVFTEDTERVISGGGRLSLNGVFS